MIPTNEIVDAKGLACPMPIVKTRKAIKELEAGQVLAVFATDKGSKADIQAWAESSGHDYLGTIEEGDVLKHYIRKSATGEDDVEPFSQVVTNEQLDAILQDEEVMLIDVREKAEFAFGHIPGAKNIPLGELSDYINAVQQEKNIYVICRTGNRSSMAAHQLVAAGCSHVTNVVPGMSKWNGSIEKSI